MLANIDMNLLLRIGAILFFFFFLLFVVLRLSESPSFTVKENNIGLHVMSLSALAFIIFMTNRDKMPEKPFKGMTMMMMIMVWGVVILVVLGLSLLVWAGLTGKLGTMLNFIWSKVFPF